MIGRPRTVLLDEPLGTLGDAARDHVLGWIADLSTSGATVVIVTHASAPFVSETRRVLRSNSEDGTVGRGPFRTRGAATRDRAPAAPLS
jgi:ABC-type lipoprotein export system ATPase subunit